MARVRARLLRAGEKEIKLIKKFNTFITDFDAACCYCFVL
jgi:hypothetical protein